MNRLTRARRMVVKIGSALLVEQGSGRIHQKWLQALIADLARRHGAGTEVVVVSSGAIAVGRRALGIKRGRPLRLADKQAAAAAGQIQLAHAYQEGFHRHGLAVAQVLLTMDDTENRQRYINARATTGALLNMGAVPVINENDTVATQEIRFGDNDRLAARVAQMVSADTLVLLSDIDGLYTANPADDPGAEFIPEVHTISPDIEAMAGATGSETGTGGMVTKLAAARIAMGAGCAMVITDGKPHDPLRRLDESGRGTWFVPAEEPRTARKHWIAASLRPTGALTVDDGALKALSGGKSLLPAGVTDVEGHFRKGEAVTVRDRRGRPVARRLAGYESDECRALMGARSDAIAEILGYEDGEELIHRDDLVVF